jgi:hypothetical protein
MTQETTNEREAFDLTRPAIDVEDLILKCIPGGDSCDPQRVADAIREYAAALAVPLEARSRVASACASAEAVGHYVTVRADGGNTVPLYAPPAAPAEVPQTKPNDHLAAPVTGAVQAQAQSCWLVEKRRDGRTVGYLGHVCGSYEWMPTPDKATRFVRREDANGVAECIETSDVIVAEHIWG